MKRTVSGTVVSILTAVLAVTAVSAPAHAATGMALPGEYAPQMLVDPVHRHVFVSTGHNTTVVSVADYAAQQVAQIPISEAYGMALSDDDRYLYVASWFGSWPESTVTQVDTATLQIVKKWSAPSEFCPKWLAVSKTRLWMSGWCGDQGLDDGSIVSTDLSLGDYRFGGLSSTGGKGRIAVDPNQTRLVFRDDDLSGAGAVVYDISGTSIGQPVGDLSMNDSAWGSDLLISDDATKMLVNTSDGSGGTSGDGASVRSLPSDNPPETLYRSGSPSAAGWTADEQWVVVSQTFVDETGGSLEYYRAADPSQPVARIPTSAFVTWGALVVTPDGSLVFTAENPTYDWGDTTLHVYAGPAPNGATSPPPPAPDTTPPTASLRPMPLVLLPSAYNVTWAASDSGSGVASVDVRFRQAEYDGPFGVWRTPWSGVTASYVRISVKPGREYCFEMRARDKAGNVSAWSAQRCLTTPLDDHSLAGGSAWVRRSASGYYEGTYSATTRRGAVLTARDAIAHRVAIVATVGPTAGTVAVYLGRTYLGRINLTANRWHNLTVIALPATSLHEGTLTLKSLTSGRLVRIDGVALIR